MRRGWIPRQSLLLLIAAALILPAIVAFAVGFASTQAERQRQVERTAMTATRQMIYLADAEVSANMRTLQIIGEAQSVTRRDWDAVRQLAVATRRVHPSWKALLLRDTRTGEVLVELADVASAAELKEPPERIPADGLAEGAFRESRYCPCVALHSRVASDPDLVLSVYLDPHVFQDILLRSKGRAEIAGIVDREGRFIARSLDYDRRVGTLATIHVRRAVEKGGEGFYRGRTYEGLDNYTAFSTSALTSWSGHVAVDRSAIDGPRVRTVAAIAVALSAGLILAVALIAFAAQDARIRRRDEQRLRELQKADTISQFTSIIVHDFRNLLAASSAGLSLIDRHTSEPKTKENVEALRKVVQRGERLVNRLLSFARSEGTELHTVDLAALLEDMDELLRRVLGGGIAYDWKVDPDARFVLANADQLELALINLARNAKEAMGGKGEFSIATHGAGEMTEVTVCDTGPGVPPEIRERIFRPFYTTKGGSAGTGLGLTQVAGAVHHAGGRVEIDQWPTGGAIFRLLLPRGEPADGERKQDGQPAATTAQSRA